MSKLILSGRLTDILGNFIEDAETMDIHIDSTEKLTDFLLNAPLDEMGDIADAQFILDMLRWVHDLSLFFRRIRAEII